MSLANGNAIRLPRSTSIRPPYQKVSFSIFMSFLWWNDYRLPAHKSSNFHTKEPRRRNCRGSYNTSLITYTIRYQTLGGSFGAHNLGGMQAVLRGFLICNFLRQKRNHPPKMIQQLEVGGVAFSLSFWDRGLNLSYSSQGQGCNIINGDIAISPSRHRQKMTQEFFGWLSFLKKRLVVQRALSKA